MKDQSPPEEALRLLRQALGASDEALALVASLQQLQDRFEDTVVPLLDEPAVWNTALTSQESARQALYHARGCVEEMLNQIAQAQAPEMQTRAWADQLVDLNERLQAALANAGQQAARFYEVIRPTLVTHYLEHATRSPRWADTWPFDVEEANRALERITAGEEFGPAEELDIQLARFRWEVGWPQQKMASVVGLSQPSVATRLARMEAWISLSVASSHVRRQAKTEGFHIVRSNVMPGRSPRGPIGEFVLEKESCLVELQLLIAAGETGAGRRGTGADRSSSLDFLRWEVKRERRRLDACVVDGVALYLRDRGFVTFYTTAQVAEVAQRLRGSATETILQHLTTAVESARTLTELTQRATNANHPEA